MTKVSVIVPNYNHSRYLKQRIDSILNQTYQDFEIILMDDKSPDNSISILKEYTSHPKVSDLLLNDINSGSTFKQWEKGVANAKGEYIWIAESDDWADPLFLEKLVAVLDSNPQVGLAYSQSYKTDSENNITGSMYEWTMYVHSERWKHDFVNNGVNEIKNYLCQLNSIPNASAVVFRKSVFQKVLPLDTSYKICGDMKVWFNMLMLSDIAFIAVPLNYFRFHEKNVRQSKSELMAEEFLNVKKYFLESFIQLGQNPGRVLIWSYLGTFFSHNEYNLIDKLKLLFAKPIQVQAEVPLYFLNKGYLNLLYRLYRIKVKLFN